MSRFYYENHDFFLDGKKFNVHSGTIHYFRIPKTYWKDRLLKLKECGLNCVETYIAWNLHEKEENQFDFSNDLDFGCFLDVAKELGLLVIVRPGPYICAEWKGGGLPYWLNKYDNLKIRSHDKIYLQKCFRYLDKVVEILKPRLLENGGNVIMIQLENEYGAYGADTEYKNALKEYYENKLPGCILFTSDGPSIDFLTNGSVDGVLATANFGNSVEKRMQILKELRPNQPYFCMEYWCGWYDTWGNKHHVRDAKDKVKCIEDFIKNDYNFNIYMFIGGSNFGFNNGANRARRSFSACTQSYDYDAFLTENGDRTPAYYMLKELLNKNQTELTAQDIKTASYGRVFFNKYAKLFDNIENVGRLTVSDKPLSFEQLSLDNGYAYYETELSNEDFYAEINDRAMVYENGYLSDIFTRGMRSDYVYKNGNGKFGLLVENLGRVNYGGSTLDKKGILQTSNEKENGWKSYALEIENTDKLNFECIPDFVENSIPAYYKGEFEVDELHDTFVKFDEYFIKGFIMINGFNLGRYWDIGPQSTLYVPASILKKGKNELVVFETDGVKETDIKYLSVELVDKPILG